jgi:hypothetical protein
MAPDFWLPLRVGDYLIGRQIRRQFRGCIDARTAIQRG